MGNEGSHRRILNRLRCSYIQFVLRRHRNVIGAVGLIPLRERTALNVNGLGLRSLVDRVRSEQAVHLPDGCPRTSALGFWTVSSHYLPRKVAILIKHSDPFDTGTPRFVLYAVLGLVVHRVQDPGANDLFFEGLLLAECVAWRKGNSEAEECHSGYSKCGTLVHCVHRFIFHFSVFVCRLPTCLEISQAPGTSVSRGVRRNALVKGLWATRKETPKPIRPDLKASRKL